MIKFFRKIRQKLISDNKVSKYFIYAAGEVVLVMIGILLALQVNNWNEFRKLKLKEKEILQEIRADIEETNSEIANDLDLHLEMLLSAQKFKERLDQKDPNIDSLTIEYMRLDDDLQVYPKSAGFETLKSQGFELINNDLLRKRISNLYQLSYTRLTNFGRLNPESEITKLLRPYTLKHFRTANQHFRVIDIEELDYQITSNRLELKSIKDLKKDEELLVMLKHTSWLRRYKISLHRRALINGVEVVELIEDELDDDFNQNASVDIDISKILIGKWKSKQFPDRTTTFFEQDDQLFLRTNINPAPKKCFILSDSRLWDENGDYLTVSKTAEDFILHVNGREWIRIIE